MLLGTRLVEERCRWLSKTILTSMPTGKHEDDEEGSYKIITIEYSPINHIFTRVALGRESVRLVLPVGGIKISQLASNVTGTCSYITESQRNGPMQGRQHTLAPSPTQIHPPPVTLIGDAPSQLLDSPRRVTNTTLPTTNLDPPTAYRTLLRNMKLDGFSPGSLREPDGFRPGSHPHRRDDGCSGWSCLTGTQQFGIIFSVVVISAVLSISYMCYLGKIASSHQELELARQRSHRRRRRASNQQLAMAQAHALQQYPAGVVYQPIMYNPAGHGVPPMLPAGNLLPAQPLQPPQQPVPMVHPYVPYQVPPLQQYVRPENPPRYSIHEPAAPSPAQPSWIQRLCRAMRIPMGRASTVASTSTSVTPVRSRSQTPVERQRSGHSASQSRSTRPPSSTRAALERDRTLSPTPVSRSHQNGEATESDSDGVESARTDAATVHSDDFELPPRRVQEHPHPPRHAGSLPDSGDTGSDGTFESGPPSTGGGSLPSVSSIRSG